MGKETVVGGDHGQGGLLRGRGGDLPGQLLLVEMAHGVFVPVAPGHEPLEAPDADLHRQGDRLDALSDEIAAQARQIDDAQGPDPFVPEDPRKGLVEPAHLLGDPGDVLRGQALFVRKLSGVGLPSGQVRSVRHAGLLLAAQAHDRAKGRIQHLDVDLFAPPVVVVAGLGLGIARRAAQAEEAGRLVARAGKVRGVHEGLHDPGADPEALLPVPGKSGQGLAQNGGGEILHLDPGKNEKAAVADDPGEMGLPLLRAPSDPDVPGRHLQRRSREGKGRHRRVAEKGEVLDLMAEELAEP